MKHAVTIALISVTGLLGLAGCASLGGTRAADDLKVTRAVLYQNGIGYFERQGEVRSQTIKLRIMPHQVTDILKSLTVVDLGSGRAVNIALPVDKTRSRRLAALPAQVRQSGGILAIARAFRGAMVTVRARGGSGTGRLVGVESLGNDQGWRLSVLRDDGVVQSFDLSKIRSLKILDRTLEVGLRKALDVALDAGSWKPVELTVHLAGPTPHKLLVSYVVEMPVWKPAYRVVLDSGKSKGLLQGWAVVDNVSGEDWNNVRLSLTAGTPLTFRYDLYSPRYVRRPDLSPKQEAMALGPPPPTEGAALAMDDDKAEEMLSPVSDKSMPMQKPRVKYKYRPKKKMSRRWSRSFKDHGRRARGMIPRPAPRRMTSSLLRKSFSALVKGTRVGSLFRYDIEEPVTIRDRQSALVSILNKQVPAEDALLYRMDMSSTYPYRAVRLKNTTGTLLESGPVAIYKDGNFVGEAVGGKVEANTFTFIPYSVDGRVLVSLQDSTNNKAARLLKIVGGQFYLEVKRVTVHAYQVANRTGKAATLYVQRRRRKGWKLTAPDKGILEEKDYYFVPVKLAAKGKTRIEVKEETPVRRWVGISSSLCGDAIALYLKDPSSDAKVSASLKEALALQARVSKLGRELRRLRRAKNTYSQRMSQVRDNLKLLGKSARNADLSRRLKKTLMDLEGKLNGMTRKLVQKDMQRGELRDRLTVLIKTITLAPSK